jgi:hypothetical protein
MKRAWLRIDPDFLVRELHLPVGTSIEQVMWANNDRDLLFLIESQELKDVDDDYAPEVEAIMQRNEPVEFVMWKYR